MLLVLYAKIHIWLVVIMKFSDVKEKHIYNVIFDPVKRCEFDKRHLALVLKKNNDKRTCIVIPLTSEDNGDGVNKINIGCIDSLPTSLKCNNTYAVINQTRTVNVSRFIALKEMINGVNTPIDCPVDDDIFQTALQYAILELVFVYSSDEKMNIFNSLFQKAKLDKCVELAYNIRRMNSNIEKYIGNKNKLEKELESLLTDFEYTLSKRDIDNGILDIFERALLTNNK